MTCNKKQTCNICNAPFKMERGCNLEKRCPACRLLGLQKGNKDDYILDIERQKSLVKEGKGRGNNLGIFRVNNGTSAKYQLLDEDIFIKRLSSLISREDGFYLDDSVMKEELIEQIYTVLEQFTEREKTVILMRFGFINQDKGDGLLDIGKELGLTKERVRQIESEAIKKLKHPRIGRVLMNYMYN